MDPVDFAQWNPGGPPPAALPGAGATMRQVHAKAQYGSVKPLLELPMALLKRFARHRRALNDAN